MTSPHSGESIPPEVTWLKDLSEPILMCDADRFVDQLYLPASQAHRIPFLCAKWHRYVVDLNRFPEDIDKTSVEGGGEPAKFSLGCGVIWSETTKGQKLLPQPISKELHAELIEKYFVPFHLGITNKIAQLKKNGAKKVYHIDCHSMPSQGGSKHKDNGEKRPDIVVSDLEGKSCENAFKDAVILAYENAGFKVAYNWPYKGGRVTETYGQPTLNQHSIQIELNRSLYMNEVSKQKAEPLFQETQQKLTKAIKQIHNWVMV